MFNPMSNNMNDGWMEGEPRWGQRPEDFDLGPGRGFHRGGMPRGFEGFDGPRCMPRRHCGPGRHGMPGGPGGFGGPGFPPHGGHGFPGGPGGFGPGGMPPRRPDPEFLKRRVEEGDLMELLDMAGRMIHRRPQGGPARGQALVLSILAGREALSQRELQQMLGIQPGSLSELLSKLEAKGYLTREKAEDRRGNLLRITDAGRQAIPQADEADGDDPFAPLTDDQQDQLAAMLRTLLNAWVDDLDAGEPRPRRLPPRGDQSQV